MIFIKSFFKSSYPVVINNRKFHKNNDMYWTKLWSVYLLYNRQYKVPSSFTGDLYFEKAVNGFLSDLFAKWKVSEWLYLWSVITCFQHVVLFMCSVMGVLLHVEICFVNITPSFLGEKLQPWGHSGAVLSYLLFRKITGWVFYIKHAS